MEGFEIREMECNARLEDDLEFGMHFRDIKCKQEDNKLVI